MRCFVAVELDRQIRDSIGRLQTTLGRPPGVRWARSDSVHLTVKFLGEIPDRDVPDACDLLAEAARAIEPFDMRVGGVGCFPAKGSPRIVWVGVDEPTGRLAECVRNVEEAFEMLGFAPEQRPYTPHITIGRVKGPGSVHGVRGALAEWESFDAGTQAVDHLVLFRSDLQRSGAVYTALYRAGLGERRA